jgi:hypothetical protein
MWLVANDDNAIFPSMDIKLYQFFSFKELARFFHVCTYILFGGQAVSNTHEGNRNHAKSYDDDLLLAGGCLLLPMLAVSNNSIRATVDDVFVRGFARS